MSKSRLSLYDRELNRFRETLKVNPDAAVSRYGFTLIHSLAYDERVTALKALGMQPNSAVDFYNLGVAAARQEDWNEATNLFKRAVELDGTLRDAVYNLAYCYERAGLVPQARSTWQVYADMMTTAEERDAVREHAAELARSTGRG